MANLQRGIVSIICKMRKK